MARSLSSNIWKYALLLVANKRVFTAILGAYYLTIPGVTPFWIGLFLLAGNGASFVFDIPSSYVADRIGHKVAIVWSRVFMLASTALYLFATTIWWIIAASVLMSIGAAFLSGVGNAFLHETLWALGREGEYRRIAGKASSIGFFVPAVLAALIPFSIGISYQVPFLIGLVLDLAGLAVAFALVPPPTSERAAKFEGVSFVQVIREGLALRFFRIALFSGIVGAVLFSVDGFRGPYQIALGVPVVWFGLFFGAGRALAALLLAWSGKIHAFLGDVYSYQRWQIAVYGFLLILLGTTTHPWVIVAVFVLDNALRYGLSQVDVGYELDIIRDHPFKATLLSASNQIQNALTMALVTVLGFSIERLGYASSFLASAGLFLVFLVPFHIWIVARGRNLAPA